MITANAPLVDTNGETSLRPTTRPKRKRPSGNKRSVTLLFALLFVFAGCAAAKKPVDTQDGGESPQQVTASQANSGALWLAAPSSTTACGQFINHAPVDPLCEDNGTPCIKRVQFEESDSLRIVSGPPGIYLEQERRDNGEWVCRVCIGTDFDPASYYDLITVSVVNSTYNPEGKEGRIYLQLVPPP